MNDNLEAELIKLHFENMLVRWGSSTPPRTGFHASSVLVKPEEWCTRRYVLADLFPDSAETPALNPWDWRRSAIFENGWKLHIRWQELFQKFGRVVRSDEDSLLELDLTHYDEERNLYFSPDAILDFGSERYVVEIKGVKQESYQELTDDLQTAMECCETVHKAYYQCQLYMHLLSLSRGIILVENKNTQDFRLWVIPYNKASVMESIHRAYEVKGGLVMYKHSQKLPTRCCVSKTDPRARQCPMANTCFSIGEKTK